jgi:hypothetical protein
MDLREHRGNEGGREDVLSHEMQEFLVGVTDSM